MSGTEPFNANAALTPIIAAVRALYARMQQLGVNKAFDPNDPQTNPLFQRLWEVSFDKQYTPDQQAQIMKQFKARHPNDLKHMREVSVASEERLELASTTAALEKAHAMEQDPTVLRIGQIRQRLAKAGEGEKAALRQQLIEARTEAFYALLDRYPYHTYQRLVGAENAMLQAYGIDADTQRQGLHYVIEAGAVPFTPIFSSILRDGGQVLGTVQDPEKLGLARQLIAACERLGILEPGAIKLINRTPAEAGGVTFDQPKPYAVTITQISSNKNNTQNLLRDFKKQGIDTVVARGADGLVRMLYEPQEEVKVPAGFTQLNGVPIGGSCYNSSTVYSTRQLGTVPDLSATHEVSQGPQRFR